ncbi:MAG: hypothetical protein WD771_11415 [Gemmatimonadaceae bacterium]
MKSLLVVLVGVALLVGGGYVLLRGGHITTQRQVLDVGGVRVSAEQRNAIAPWMAGIALVAGTGLVLVGLTRKL